VNLAAAVKILFIYKYRHGMTERDVMKRISVYRVAGADTDSLLGILSNFFIKRVFDVAL
jgi:hypothetical protein